MSDLRKNNENNKSVRNLTVLNSATQLSVLKMNRLVLAMLVGLMAMVIFMGILLMPADDLALQPAQAVKAVDLSQVQMNPVLSAEVDALKSQLVALVSGSIESKLNILEESLRSGTISETGLDTIQALQEDLVVLKTYSATGAGRLIAQKYLPQPKNIETIALAEQVSQLKGLVHFLITSCGLMIAVIGGVWVRRRYALEDNSSEQQKIS
ncbi:conserved hypothetical protein [Bathymodiolus platifrons methanotrophic gill symbiont]|uniref:hypothetical protein n=1 Tax=Bathymodiolus platifrons methanotrophic gill symbiont TaxID=113268 RepID=UPI000B41DD49|nr:hypothetical protein [Bathymodiolus platifrons methanotrophic gill symbiont]MCK5870339.1 hypothetical protein [Methyloprofundus sp.]TXK93916.1 hypothetical protein BMR10_14620 [Methylococcaceae bacterium CS4]TXL00716.1 hypothetical protein BMR11_02620 [Methylococcaceae bacterium CS5]TXL00758.1 hypothetical protein BMR02_05075 [Methylococcaceae bacterium HT1]TXL07449.1 hypothetical protein BMR07_04845 [Methylococcaceae bacterium CS1]TXL07550.1 hypothetical protein BMR08_14770 [Methylococcac